jgi:nitroimidazol reductase NimA-like FMN-containing flavoprotein (pyridoxamine 5'-phosphate oxidase superfamily)
VPISREKLRLTPEELDLLLDTARVAHVATADAEDGPHVMPLWFVWHDGALWMNSLIRSRRTRDIGHDARVAVCVDAGEQYAELRGVVFYGRFEQATDSTGLQAAKEAFARKYWGGSEVPSIRSHTWLKLVPDRMVSWDFRLIPAGRDKRLEAAKAAQAEE